MTDLILFREGFVPSKSITLAKEEFLHLSALRRKDLPSMIEIRDGLGNIHFYNYQPKSKELEFVKTDSLPLKNKRSKIAIALPKGNRLDFFLQKVTEMGVTNVNFLLFRHSVRREFNLERAKKIVKEAASQSKQVELLQLEISEFSSWIVENQNASIVFHPHSKLELSQTSLKNKIPVIGPEGGFHLEEEGLLEELKVPKVCLPGGILRTETAGLVAGALLQYAT
ncbi:MAG: RsmE family RNA methyltransferase [Leptospira sp.]|nr:RsmE family RNA methyltransferase [Leptospira sp.]